MRGANQDSATPYCRCRVLYLGSSVPHTSKEGLWGVQQPLRELYPEQGAVGARGIDSWLSVWSNGLLLENVDEHRKKVTRFFPIEALHYCAAVRYVKGGNKKDGSATRFLPLDSPFGRIPIANHPPLFAAVIRRTTGIKVLECHAFICKRDMAANALVRCCFHAYADSSYAKGLDPLTSTATNTNSTTTSNHATNGVTSVHPSNNSLYHTLGGSSTTLDSPQTTRLDATSTDDISLYNGDENHKVWARGKDEVDIGAYQEQGTLRSTKGSRPRQIIPPLPPPPPPPRAQLFSMEKITSTPPWKTVERAKKMKNRGMQEEMMQQRHYQIHPGVMNGYGHHTLGHPVRQQHYHPHPLPPSSRSVAGTLARPAPVLLVPAATLPRKHHARGLRPIPAAAPIVPIYAPLPVVPPPPPGAMYPVTGTYGTAGNRSRRHHHHHHHHPETETASLAASRRMAASHPDLTAANPAAVVAVAAPEPVVNSRNQQDSPDNDSRFGTGIYRRKGHLNERAFSYSIRAEHRSRSHGSLASLNFSAQNGAAGQPNGLPKEEKKDREIAQLVAGLNIHENGEKSSISSSPSPPNHNSRGAYHHHYQPQQQQPPQPLPRPRPR